MLHSGNCLLSGQSSPDLRRESNHERGIRGDNSMTWIRPVEVLKPALILYQEVAPAHTGKHAQT